jgi:anthranilate phosphoribosyltransferase
MKELLLQLYEGHTLSQSEAYDALAKISGGEVNTHQIASMLTVYNMRNITVDELLGFRSCLLDLRKKINFDDFDTVDLCGTGGDGKHTFNISTLASFVVAGAGYKVAKHGNYAVSSLSGSSNVLEGLGYKFTNEEDQLKLQLEKAGICFMHAPLFHPALKGVGPIRRDLGVKTFFNMLGPLVNPAQPKHQMVGVYALHLASLYKYVHLHLDKSFCIVYDLAGYDEISLTNEAKLITNRGTHVVSPQSLGLPQTSAMDISGGNSLEESKNIFLDIISGKGSESQNNVVIVNAAFAIKTFKPEMTDQEAIELAKDSLINKKALEVLNKLINIK